MRRRTRPWPTMLARDARLRQALNEDPKNTIPLEDIAENLGITMDDLYAACRRLACRTSTPLDLYVVIPDDQGTP
jgi:hypothetical protein